MAAPYQGPYQIHPLELPANQNAAALYTVAGSGTPNSPGNPFLISLVDPAKTTWSSSPLVGNTNGAGGQSSFTDVPPTGAVSRTSTANASLAVEQARLQGRADNLNRDITVVGTTP